MISAKAISASIRKKRKEIKADGVENMIDTAPGPQMNPQDILNLKQKAQIEETLDVPEKSMAPDDPADESIEGTSQEKSYLKRQMGRLSKILGRMSVG